MAVFTAEIAGQPTIVFAARDHAIALAFMHDDFIRSEFADLRTLEGVPLWPPGANHQVRPANADESAHWERSLVEDLVTGVHESRKDAIESNGFSILVEYLEPDE